jgi:hypothetical protein
MDVYVLWNGGAWFVKERSFAEQQSREHPVNRDGHRWLDAWKLIYDVDGLEHGRDKARLLYGERGERWVPKQTKGVNHAA